MASISRLRPTPWSVVFDEWGGFGNVSSGYHIQDANGQFVCTVDVADYETADQVVGRSEAAEIVANFICEIVSNRRSA